MENDEINELELLAHADARGRRYTEFNATRRVFPSEKAIAALATSIAIRVAKKFRESVGIECATYPAGWDAARWPTPFARPRVMAASKHGQARNTAIGPTRAGPG
ncbi:hypothetical protein [Zobellella sp. DQSA1]|uniref:hypothetical protein n=1 Tax=Zobellella sp. DQSA1 TaxID=3342386 RepID=UPI0035C00279